MKAISMAILAAAALGLAACGEKTAGAQGGDPNAGLDVAIRSWHAELKANDPQCKGRPEGEQCRVYSILKRSLQEIRDKALADLVRELAPTVGTH